MKDSEGKEWVADVLGEATFPFIYEGQLLPCGAALRTGLRSNQKVVFTHNKPFPSFWDAVSVECH